MGVDFNVKRKERMMKSEKLLWSDIPIMGLLWCPPSKSGENKDEKRKKKANKKKSENSKKKNG